MKISVCMIVKNEEEVLERCLSCAVKFADEIIIVDTGSTDNTKNIAKKFTNNVFDFKWQDDFSLARNFSFSKAKCDYIMWLDADDVIDEENVQKILNLKHSKKDADVFMLKYAISFDKNNNPTFEYYRERLLKNNGKLKWQGFIHEAIAPKGKIEYTNIRVEHRKTKNSDPKRNLKIYRKHLKKNGVLDARSAYYYGKELFYNGYYTKSVQILQKFLKMENICAPNEHDAILTISKCLKIKNKNNKAIKILLNALSRIEPTSELMCELADNFARQKIYNKAICFYKFALQLTPNLASGQFVELKYYHYIPLLELVRLNYLVGDLKNSLKYHFISEERYPEDEKVLYNKSFFENNFTK